MLPSGSLRTQQQRGVANIPHKNTVAWSSPEHWRTQASIRTWLYSSPLSRTSLGYNRLQRSLGNVVQHKPIMRNEGASRLSRAWLLMEGEDVAKASCLVQSSLSITSAPFLLFNPSREDHFHFSHKQTPVQREAMILPKSTWLLRHLVGDGAHLPHCTPLPLPLDSRGLGE